MRAAVAVLILGVLSGCMGSAPRSAAPEGQIVLGADGLQIQGTGLEIGFGRHETGAVAAVSRLLGSDPVVGPRFASGCRVFTWNQDIALHFSQGSFSGWEARPRAFPSQPGLGASQGRLC